MSTFIYVYTGNPKNAYGWVLIGPTLMAVILKSLLFWLFMQSWSSKHWYFVDNLLCQPHLYLSPLSRLLKWFDCLGSFVEPQLHRWTPVLCTAGCSCWSWPKPINDESQWQLTNNLLFTPAASFYLFWPRNANKYLDVQTIRKKDIWHRHWDL